MNIGLPFPAAELPAGAGEKGILGRAQQDRPAVWGGAQERFYTELSL